MMGKGSAAVDHENAMHETGMASTTALVESYRQMAADIEREVEAEEWMEQVLFEAE